MSVSRVSCVSLFPVLVLLTSCAPDLGPSPTLLSSGTLESSHAFDAPPTTWPTDAWWRSYGDPELDTLVDEALAGAPDLRAAEARVREAEAGAQQAGAALLPNITGNGSVQETKQSLNEGFPAQFQRFLPHGWYPQGDLTASIDYELDIFGKNRAALAAATSDATAARVDLAAARLVLSTSVAAAYAELVQLQADRTEALDAVNVRRQSVELVAERARHDLENRGVVDQADAELKSAQADAEHIEGQIARKRDELAALVGKGPDRGLAIVPPEKVVLRPLGLPPALSADLVSRRPDLAAARLRAEAAAHRIDVAKADFYPNIDLEAAAGFRSLGLSTLINHGSLVGQVGPALHLPIFEGGRIEGAYRASRAEYDEAVATYDETLVTAFKDVADTVASERALAREREDAKAALESSESAYRIAELRYRGGLSRYLDVLTAEDTMLTQRRRVADLEAQGFALDIALVRALGGGFAANVHG